MKCQWLILMIVLTQPLFGQQKSSLLFGLACDLPAIYAPKYFDGVTIITRRPGIGARGWFEYRRGRFYLRSGYVFHKISVNWNFSPNRGDVLTKTANINQFHIPIWIGYNILNKSKYTLGIAGMLGIVNWQGGIYSVYYRNGNLLQGQSTVPYRHVLGVNIDFNRPLVKNWSFASTLHYKSIRQSITNKYFQETDHFQVNNSYIGISLGIQYRIK